MNCFYTNADSLINKFEEFKRRVELNKHMIVGITEVKQKKLRFPINPSEYDMFHNIDVVNGRGIALYIHKSLKASPFLKMDTNSEYQESVWAEVSDMLLVGCVYRSPGSSSMNNEKLNTLINEAANYKHTHFLLLGDFNYPSIDWDVWNTISDNSPDFNLIQCLRDNALFQHVMCPTRGRMGNRSNILDLVITNEIGMVDEIRYESPLGKSDHSVINVDFRCYAEFCDTKVMKYYYDRGDYASMKSKLENVIWNDVPGSGDINAQWRNFKGYFDG